MKGSQGKDTFLPRVLIPGHDTPVIPASAGTTVGGAERAVGGRNDKKGMCKESTIDPGRSR